MGRAAMSDVRRMRDKGLVAPRDEELAVLKIRLLLIALVALASVGGSSASPTASPLGPIDFVVGATEDQTLGIDDGGATLYRQMTSHGLGAIRMSVDYQPTAPRRPSAEGAARARHPGGNRRRRPRHALDLAGSQLRRDGRAERRAQVRRRTRRSSRARSRRSPTSSSATSRTSATSGSRRTTRTARSRPRQRTRPRSRRATTRSRTSIRRST